MMEKNEREVSNAYRTFYPMLLAVLPIEDIMMDFFSRELLSKSHKAKIDSYSDQKNKIKYFLDDVIHPNIRIGEVHLFNEMLAAMGRSDDVTARGVANKIKKVISPPSCTPVKSTGMCMCQM